jgi:hypothetical protein
MGQEAGDATAGRGQTAISSRYRERFVEASISGTGAPGGRLALCPDYSLHYYMSSVTRIAFVALYLTLTVGISIATHLCGGEPVSTDLLSHRPSEPDDCCGPNEHPGGCCSTVVTTVRIDDAHVLNAEWAPVFAAFDLPGTSDEALCADPAFTIAPRSAGPPFDGPPLHILHSVLLI